MKSRPMNEFDQPLLAPVFRPSLALWSVLGVSLLSGCAALDRPLRTPDVSAAVRAELPPAAPTTVVPTKVSDALAEPAAPPVPLPPEPRLDLLVNNAQVREVFLAIVADTRYSMLMHPDVSGTLSVTLRGVTVTEALEAIRDVYGYDFKIDGRRITVYAPTLQTRVFTINYPTSLRSGSSELRVSSGAALQSSATGTTASTGNASTAAQQPENSRVSTTSRSDFWGELAASVRSLVGTGEGRNVVSSPQAGILAVRAMPEELRQVDKFLKATQASVERQVMLEAKIVEVQLSDATQTGVNWSLFGGIKSGGNKYGTVGIAPGTTLSNTGAMGNSSATITPGAGVIAEQLGKGFYGLAVQGSNFVYSLILSNAGPSVASNAFTSDQLPTNFVFVSATSGDAPLDTRDSREVSPPNTARVSNTHCIARPGRPTNGSSSTARSNPRSRSASGAGFVRRVNRYEDEFSVESRKHGAA